MWQSDHHAEGRGSTPGLGTLGVLAMRRLLMLIVVATVLTLGVVASSAGAQDTPPPSDVGGTVVTRDPGTETSAGSLPLTGSTGTGTYVLLGLGLAALGGVLVVAGRRHGHVLNRS